MEINPAFTDELAELSYAYGLLGFADIEGDLMNPSQGWAESSALLETGSIRPTSLGRIVKRLCRLDDLVGSTELDEIASDLQHER